eukprot:jgi/Psemu1/52702/gm1.52702_g
MDPASFAEVIKIHKEDMAHSKKNSKNNISNCNNTEACWNSFWKQAGHLENKKKRRGDQFWRESQLSHCGIVEVNVNSNNTDIENEQVELVILNVGKESPMNIHNNDPQNDDEYDNVPLIRLLNKL